AFLAMDYPRKLNLAHLAETYPGTSEFIRAWNLGLIEFLYLVPINLVILYLAFRPSKRSPAGFVTVLTGVLYTPVRFFLDFLRPEDTDPRYFGLTFAQWASILAFGVALYAASRILKTGAPAETVTRTSREAQERLKIILREDEDSTKRQQTDKQTEAERKRAEIARARAERDREDAELAAAEAARAKADAGVGAAAAAEAADDDGDDDDGEAAGEAPVEVAAQTAVEAATAKPAATAKAGGAKPAAARPGAGKSGGGKSGAKKTKSRKR
ncbi:MAG TPA: prolipoprotein diacylglyceryl transferase family protein, partial [Kofleriaceae bacterium]|nr:prolipoprotein diacylglyceryl transferase family protein [Kofleriaceae bacterium]